MAMAAWRAQVPGNAAVQVLGLDPAQQSVYVADGWGVAYAASRLRRLDLAHGGERASVRLGNAARCIAFHDGSLLMGEGTIVHIDLDEEAVRPEPAGKPGPCVDATVGDGLVWLLPGRFVAATASADRVAIRPGPAARHLVRLTRDAGRRTARRRARPRRG